MDIKIKYKEYDEIANDLISGEYTTTELVTGLVENNLITYDEISLTTLEIRYLLDNYFYVLDKYKKDNTLKLDLIDTYEKLAYYLYLSIDQTDITIKNNTRHNKEYLK